MYPYQEKDQSRPRGVLGMFDVSARPFVPDNKLTFAVPLNKFMSMVNNMEESNTRKLLDEQSECFYIQSVVSAEFVSNSQMHQYCCLWGVLLLVLVS